MGGYKAVRKLLAVVVAVAMVTSVSVGPALADDEISIGTDGVSVGGDDGLSVSVGDDENGGTGTVSADGSQNEQEVSVGGSGAAGGSDGSVECTVSSDTAGTPCQTDSGGGGGSPVPVGDGGLPVDPSLPGGGGGAPSLPGGGGGAPSLPESDSGTRLAPLVDTPAGVVQVVVVTGGRTMKRTAVLYRGEGIDQADHATVIAGPNDGTATVGALGGAQDRPVGTTITCGVRRGALSACSVVNNPPATFSEVPYEQAPAFPAEAPVSWGLLKLVVDAMLVQPQSAIGLGASQIASNTPEQSPVNVLYLPYNPNNPPVDVLRPEESIDPSVTPMDGSGSAMMYGGTFTLNDEVDGVAGVGIDQESSSIAVAGAGTEGQNYYHAVAVVSPNGVILTKSGFLSGRLVLGPDRQRGSGELDLGGQPYGASFPPEDGGSGGGGVPSAPSLPGGGSAPSLPGGGSLPADPSQPPELPSGSLPVGAVPLPADPSVPA